MIEITNASVAYATMLGSQRTKTSARVAKSGQNIFPFFPLVKVRNLLYGGKVTISVQWYIPWIPSICYDPTYPHEQIPINKTVVRSPNLIPGNGYTL